MKKIDRRSFLKLCGAAGAASALAACGGGGSSSAAGGGNAGGGDQGGAAAAGPIELTLWGSDTQQDLLKEMADAFVAANADAQITVALGAVSEADAKDTVLTDPEVAADVYCFADDQINELVNAKAIQEVVMNPDEIKSRNSSGSVDAATVNGVLYAYPMTASNGYFMYYNSSVFTADDVKTLDRMMEVAAAAGKKVAMEMSGAWYLYSFFKGAGLDLYLLEDGQNNFCNWNEEPGAKVVDAMLAIANNPGFLNAPDADLVAGIKDGTVVAGVNGTWNASVAEEAWGPDYAAAKLPTYTLDGQQVQMWSFSGYKLVGVNPYSKNAGYAMMLADWITNEANQVLRFEKKGEGPSNVNAASTDAVKAAPAIAALSAQGQFAVPQRVGGNYWGPAGTLGAICADGKLPAGKTSQDIVDEVTAGIVSKVG